jgi:hypothetical protein
MQVQQSNVFSQLLSNMMLQRMAQQYKQRELDLERQMKEKELQSNLMIHGISPTGMVSDDPAQQQEQGILGKLFGSLLGQGKSSAQTPVLNTATNEHVNQIFGQSTQQGVGTPADSQQQSQSRPKLRIGNMEFEMPTAGREVQARAVYGKTPDGNDQLLGHWLSDGKSHTFQALKEPGDLTTDKLGSQWVQGRTDELVASGIPRLKAQGMALTEFYNTRGPVVPVGSYGDVPAFGQKGYPGQAPRVIPGNFPKIGSGAMDAGITFGADGKPTQQPSPQSGPQMGEYRPPGTPFPTSEEDKEIAYLRALKQSSNELKSVPGITKHTGPVDYSTQWIANQLNLDPDNFATSLLGGKTASPEAASTYAKLAGLYRMVYGESGKQINEIELKKLQERMPTKWDSDTDFKAKLAEFDKLLDQVHDARISTMEAGGKRNTQRLREEYKSVGGSGAVKDTGGRASPDASVPVGTTKNVAGATYKWDGQVWRLQTP